MRWLRAWSLAHSGSLSTRSKFFPTFWLLRQWRQVSLRTRWAGALVWREEFCDVGMRFERTRRFVLHRNWTRARGLRGCWSSECGSTRPRLRRWRISPSGWAKQLDSSIEDLHAVEATRKLAATPDATVDVRAELEVRIARLLSGLAELHRGLVLRDAAYIQAEMRELRDLLAQVRAEVEVETILSGNP